MATNFGKFRALVVDTVDPLDDGRLKVDVPGVGIQGAWAAACLPPVQVGMLAWPQVGDTVWVEFEGGDLAFPVWTGVAWKSGAVVPAGGAVVIESASVITLRAAKVAVEAPLVDATGIVTCHTLNAMGGVISPSYTPGAGNIW